MKVEISKATVDDIITKLSQGDNIRAGFLMGKKEGNQVIVEGVYVPKQENTTYSATIAKEEQKKAFEAIKAAGKEVVGFAQYNGNFKPFESLTNMATLERLSQLGMPKVGLIVNANGDYKLFP